jgi:2,3-bisphosphoglycerate-independent phosphoglycerate mutase
VKPIADSLAGVPEHRILVCPDHPTFIATKTHSRGAVPFLLAGTGIEGAGGTYDEVAAAAAVASDPAARIEPGWTLMERFLDRSV